MKAIYLLTVLLGALALQGCGKSAVASTPKCEMKLVRSEEAWVYGYRCPKDGKSVMVGSAVDPQGRHITACVKLELAGVCTE